MDLTLLLLSVFFLTFVTVEGFRITNQAELKEAISAEARRLVTADFDELARQYALRKGQEYNRQVRWWDIYGRQSHLAQQYPDKKISVSTGPVYYGTIKRTIDKPGYVYSQWFHNSQSNQPIQGQITRTESREASFTWSLEEALKIGLEISSTAGVPALFGASAKFSTELSFKATQAKTTTTTETFSVSNTVTVDPQTSVKVEWTITDREMEISWEADVYINGWIAMWFEEKYDGHWLWFHPIYSLANDKFRWYGSGLIYRAKGSFFGVRGLEATLKTYEYPVMQGFREDFVSRISPLKETVVVRSTADRPTEEHGD